MLPNTHEKEAAAPENRHGDTPEAQTRMLDAGLLKQLQNQFQKRGENHLALNAVTQTAVQEVALRREKVIELQHPVSHKLDTWSATNQKASGRCWFFAGLNLLRPATMRKLHLKEFEFSQNWTLFWDKLERANHFLENIIDTASRELDERTVTHLLKSPIGDGGQWHMFVDIVDKYGLVPKAHMPETVSSSRTGPMNKHLNLILRRGARDLRKQTGGAEANERDTLDSKIQKQKTSILEAVYRVLCIHLGEPPNRFDFQWRDKDNQFHREEGLTPKAFAENYVEQDLNEYVCLVNDPREGHPTNHTYTVERLGNVVGGSQVLYLNVAVDVMKEAALRTILDGEPVWMGCAVGETFHRNKGLWDPHLYDFEALYGMDMSFSKADRLAYGHAAMSHAMLFTGADVIAEEPHPRARTWRVENSWGEQGGEKGFYTMSDAWFDEHVYEIAVHRRYLSEELIAATKQEPTVLPPWDPMGALA